MTALRAKWTNLDAWHVHQPFCLKKHVRTIRDFSSSHKTFSNRTLRMIFVSIHMRRHLNILRYFQWKVRYFANCDLKIPRNERALEVLVYLLGKVISIKLLQKIPLQSKTWESNLFRQTCDQVHSFDDLFIEPFRRRIPSKSFRSSYQDCQKLSQDCIRWVDIQWYLVPERF